ncbi:MAG: hypothetical protein ACKOC5_02640 [Chloroflexota bacterium]
MDRPVELIPLRCLNCATPIAARPDEVAWACPQCGQGLALDQQKGLAPLQIQYAAGLPANREGRPFWVVNGKVALQRMTFGEKGKVDQQSDDYWAQPHRFYLPAYDLGLDEMLSNATRLLAEPPNLQAGPPGRFCPVTLGLDDLQPVIEYLVTAIEAGRKDRMRALGIKLNLSQPVLWVLP